MENEIFSESSDGSTKEEDKQALLEQYGMLWKDFVQVRIDLFENDLKSFMLNDLKCKAEDVDYLYQFFKFSRKSIGVLAFDSHNYGLQNNSFDNYKQMVDRFENNKSYNSEYILNYLLIWSCIYNLMFFTSDDHHAVGFDRELVVTHDFFNGDGNGSGSNDKLIDLCCDYLINQFARSGIFGDYVTLRSQLNIDNIQEWDEKTATNRNKTQTKCKNVLFDNERKDIVEEFQKLIEYSMKDISIENIKCWQVNINNDHPPTLNSTQKFYLDYDCGLSFVIVNRLAYAVYHDLCLMEKKENQEQEQKQKKKKMMFPKLEKLYKFLYNFSLYFHCYPHNSNNEIYFINQYFSFKDKIFDNNNFGVDCGLSQFNYFNRMNYMYDGNGTILHRATAHDYRGYCRALMTYGFDCEKLNQTYPRRKCASDIAKDNKNLFLVEMMQQEIKLKRIENEEKENSRDYFISSNESIDEQAELFCEKLMFAQYFHMILGRKPDKSIEIDVPDEEKHIPTGRSLYIFPRNKLNVPFCESHGLIKRDAIFKDDLKESGKFMDNIVLAMMNLLKNKVVISDDLLILCYDYCYYNNEKLLNQFIECFNNCVKECLSGENMRNYYYFKEFLLFSSILLFPKLFVTILRMTDEELKKQKEFIWNSVETIKKENEKGFMNLCNVTGESLGVEVVNVDKGKMMNWKIRQDCIENGITAVKTERELYVIAATLNSNDKKTDFNVFNEFNQKIYITQCLTFAHEYNTLFQNLVSQAFESDKKAQFDGGPVKQYARCLVKANTDYSKEIFPSGAHILDYMRCSVTYNNVESLLEGLNNFVDKVNKKELENDKGGLSCIKRVKNGFMNILNWKSSEDAQYCDLKLKFNTFSSSLFHMLICQEFVCLLLN